MISSNLFPNVIWGEDKNMEQATKIQLYEEPKRKFHYILALYPFGVSRVACGG